MSLRHFLPGRQDQRPRQLRIAHATRLYGHSIRNASWSAASADLRPGVLYAAARDAGQVLPVPAPNRSVPVLQGLHGPHSVTFRGNDLYVAVDDGVLRFHDAVTNELVIRGAAERLLTLPEGEQHSSRTAAIGPDDQLYVTAGSTCNFCREQDPRRAAMMRYDIDGGNGIVLAHGLRNSVDFAWHPLTGELGALDNGGDGLGHGEPPEEINVIQSGGDYGWPDCVGQKRAIDWGDGLQPGRCLPTLGPEQEMQGPFGAAGNCVLHRRAVSRSVPGRRFSSAFTARGIAMSRAAIKWSAGVPRAWRISGGDFSTSDRAQLPAGQSIRS